MDRSEVRTNDRIRTKRRNKKKLLTWPRFGKISIHNMVNPTRHPPIECYPPCTLQPLNAEDWARVGGVDGLKNDFMVAVVVFEFVWTNSNSNIEGMNLFWLSLYNSSSSSSDVFFFHSFSCWGSWSWRSVRFFSLSARSAKRLLILFRFSFS